MQVDYIIRQLDLNKGAIEQLLKIKKPEEAVWKESEDRWCMLEIICHLVDEEIEDFRTRVNTALNPQEKVFIPIDPAGWVKERKYIEQDYQEKTEQWVAEREKSLHWLQSLEKPDWQSSLQHPELGAMTAARLLANWLTHDHIHIRQILKVKQAYLANLSGQDLSYAGNW